MRSTLRSFFIDSLALLAALIVTPLLRLRAAWGRPQAASGAVVTPMSLNDPQWGKRGGSGGSGGSGGGNDGPPDLDEVFRKFKQQLAGLFGQKSGGNGSGGGDAGGPSKAAMGGGVALAAVLSFGVWLFSGFYTVQEGKRGVEFRLGKYVQTTSPGLRWRWAYPIEAVEMVDISNVRAIEVGHRGNQKTKVPEEALMLTEDQNIVDVQFAVQYTLSSPEEYLFYNREPDEAVRQVAETAMREIVGKSKMDFVLYEGRGDISTRVQTLMQSILNLYKTGIRVSTVTMQNVQPPQQVQASFDDAVRAKQDRERLKNEGEAYANDILPKARGMAARLLEEASGHKQRVIANAQGDASRFSQVLVEYEKAPQVTRERIYLDTMQQVLQNTSKVVVDQKGGQNLLYLPLDKLMQMSGSTSTGTDATPRAIAPTEAAPPPTTEATVPRRDLRSRDNR